MQQVHGAHRFASLRILVGLYLVVGSNGFGCYGIWAWKKQQEDLTQALL